MSRSREREIKEITAELDGIFSREKSLDRLNRMHRRRLEVDEQRKEELLECLRELRDAELRDRMMKLDLIR